MPKNTTVDGKVYLSILKQILNGLVNIIKMRKFQHNIFSHYRLQFCERVMEMVKALLLIVQKLFLQWILTKGLKLTENDMVYFRLKSVWKHVGISGKDSWENSSYGKSLKEAKSMYGQQCNWTFEQCNV